MGRSILVGLLCFSIASIPPSFAHASMITLQEISAEAEGLSEQALRGLDNPDVQAQLAAFGIAPSEAKERLAALSDKELRDLIASQTGQQAGGDIIIGVTSILLIIIIILLIR